MGEAKRRKEALGDKYGQAERIYPWLPLTKTQAGQFSKWTSIGAWTGISLLMLGWVVIRFIGPGLGWWDVN